MKNRNMNVLSIFFKQVLATHLILKVLKVILLFFLFTHLTIVQTSQENTFVIEYQKHLLSSVIQPAFKDTLFDGNTYLLSIITSYLSISPRQTAVHQTESIETIQISSDDRQVMFAVSSGIYAWSLETGECAPVITIPSWAETSREKLWTTHYFVEWCDFAVRVRSMLTGDFIQGGMCLAYNTKIMYCNILGDQIIVLGVPIGSYLSSRPTTKYWVVKSWQPTTNKLRIVKIKHPEWEKLRHVFVQDDANLLLIGDAHVYAWNLHSDGCVVWLNLATTELFESIVFCFFSPDRQYIVTLNDSGVYHIGTTTNWDHVKTITKNTPVCYPLLMSCDNQIMVEEHWDYINLFSITKYLILRWWKTETCVCLRSWTADLVMVENTFGSANMSKDGKLLLYADYRSTMVRLWNVKTRQHVLTIYERIPAHCVTYEGPKFLSDSSLLLSISDDQQLQLIDVGNLHFDNAYKIKQRLFIIFLERYRIKYLFTKLFKASEKNIKQYIKSK